VKEVRSTGILTRNQNSDPELGQNAPSGETYLSLGTRWLADVAKIDEDASHEVFLNSMDLTTARPTGMLTRSYPLDDVEEIRIKGSLVLILGATPGSNVAKWNLSL